LGKKLKLFQTLVIPNVEFNKTKEVKLGSNGGGNRKRKNNVIDVISQLLQTKTFMKTFLRKTKEEFSVQKTQQIYDNKSKLQHFFNKLNARKYGPDVMLKTLRKRNLLKRHKVLNPRGNIPQNFEIFTKELREKTTGMKLKFVEKILELISKELKENKNQKIKVFTTH